MDDDIASLNYDCNYNLYLAKRLVIDMKKFRDRQNAVTWLRFLMNTSSNDIVEMKLRNDLMHYLVLNLQECQLRKPFDKPPPIIIRSLTEISAFIPSKMDFIDDGGLDSTTDLDDPVKEKSMIAKLSPDDGVFLASQPVPHHGSFCYLAITSKKKEN